MKRSALLALALFALFALFALPGVAHAAQGTIVFRADNDSVVSGMIGNGPNTVATYRANNAWWLYDDGQTHHIVDDTYNVEDVFVTGSGAAFYRTRDGGLFYWDDGSAAPLVQPGMPCPDGEGGEITSFGSPLVVEDDAAHLSIGCTFNTSLYRVTSGGDIERRVYDGLPVPGFDAAAGMSQVGGAPYEWVPAGPGEFVVTAQVGGCEPDPLCSPLGTFGTFVLGGSDAQALHIAGAQTVGIEPAERSEIMTRLRVNESGDVAFALGGTQFSTFTSIYVWRPDGTARRVAGTGDAAPGTGGTFSGVDIIQIDAAGFVSFLAGTTDGSGSLWQETGAGMKRVLWTGQELPGYPGSSLVSIDEVRTSADGRLAAIISTNGSGGLPGKAVVAHNADAEIEVAWHRWEEIVTGNDVVLIDADPGFGDPGFVDPGFGPGATLTRGNGMDGRGRTFADGGRLLLTASNLAESTAFVLELDGTSQPPDNEIDLQFRLNNDVPIYWGADLDMDAILFNFSDPDITFHEMRFQFSPAVSDPDVDCGAFEFDPAQSELSPMCDANVVISDSLETGFTVQTPFRAMDGDLVITAWADTRHADGTQSSAMVTSRFSLLATPDGVDLAISVDDVDAATSFTVRNVGVRPATGVMARTTLDEGAGFFAVPDEDRCIREGDDNLLACNVGDLAPGEQVTVEFPVGSDGSGVVVVESVQPDANPDDNSARFTLLIEVDVFGEGCGCTSGPGPTGIPLWWSWVVLLGLRRRPASGLAGDRRGHSAYADSVDSVLPCVATETILRRRPGGHPAHASLTNRSREESKLSSSGPTV